MRQSAVVNHGVLEDINIVKLQRSRDEQSKI
jgi:hypothetical protein